MIIRLPWTSPIDTLNLPEDFEDQVKESFKDFTKGTSTDYTWMDKMTYISRLPLIFRNTTNLSDLTIAEGEVIKDLIHERSDYELEEEDDVIDRDDIYSFDFMCKCFAEGMRYMKPLQEYEPSSCSKNDETEKVMFRIMQIVIDWEPEA